MLVAMRRLALIDWSRRMLRTYTIAWSILAVAMCLLLAADLAFGVTDHRLRTYLSVAFLVAGVLPAAVLMLMMKVVLPVLRWLAFGPTAALDRPAHRR
jgi:hypothetical protein